MARFTFATNDSASEGKVQYMILYIFFCYGALFLQIMP